MLVLQLLFRDESKKLLHECLFYKKIFVNKSVMSEAILTMGQECLNRRQYILTYQNSSFAISVQLIGERRSSSCSVGIHIIRGFEKTAPTIILRAVFSKGKVWFQNSQGFGLSGVTCQISWHIIYRRILPL